MRSSGFLRDSFTDVTLLKIEIDRLSTLTRTLTIENDSLRIKYEQQRDETDRLYHENAILRTSNGRVIDLEDRVSLLSRENQKLNSLLVEKIDEINEWRLKYAKADQTAHRVDEVSHTNEHLTSILINKNRENDNLHHKLDVLGDVESRLQASFLDRERLNNLLNEKYQEIESLKLKLSRSESENVVTSTQVDQTEKKLALLLVEKERLTHDKDNLNSVILERTRELERLRLRAQDADVLEYKVRNLDNEKLKLNDVVIDKLRENDDLRTKNAAIPHLEDRVEVVEKDRENIRQLLIEKERTVADLRIRISSLEKELIAFDEVKVKLSAKASENERLNVNLIDKLKEIDSLRRRVAELEDTEARLSISNQDNSRLSSVLSEKIRDIEDLRHKLLRIDVLERELRDVESLLNVERSKNERLNSLLSEKINAIHDWEKKYATLEDLYLDIKETTKELNLINQKYQQTIEVTERVDPTLKLSSDAKALRKSGILDKSLKISQAFTDGSPTRKTHNHEDGY